LRILWLALALVACLAAPATAQSASMPSDALIRELHDLVNTHRERVGCQPLGWHGPSARVADAHSEDMARRRYFDHVSPEGKEFTKRLLAGGVTWHGPVSENLAQTPAGAASVMELWLDSPGHRRNIENCAFTHQGLGVYRDMWTQLLVTEPRP
jgi:uncharacterized protein YkwD